MRIQIVHYNPAAPGEAGGAESAIRDQQRALQGLGHDVRIEFNRPDRAYVRYQPDIIHFHTIHEGLGMGVLKWAQVNKIPHVLSLHDYWPFCSDRMLMKYSAMPDTAHGEGCAAVEGVCDRHCVREPADSETTAMVNASPTVTFNPYSAEILRRNGVHVTAVIPHGINTAMFKPAPEKRQANSIVTVSAWPRYATKGMHILRAALKQVGAQGVLITGVSREKVRDALQMGDIFVFPSCYQETWGLCLTEAMACGCACIASDVAGPRYQAEQSGAVRLFENNNPDALADQLRWMLDHPIERRALGDKAAAWAREHATLERMARDSVAFYEKVLACGGEYGAIS